MEVRCEDCGGHVAVDAQGDLNNMVCPHCGSPRPFRDQPSPVRSDGTLRNMVDSDSQVDQGGNPLGEGTIVGSDGEVPLDTGNRGRDNYMHSSIPAILAADIADHNHQLIGCPHCNSSMDFYPRSGDAAELVCPGCGHGHLVGGDVHPEDLRYPEEQWIGDEADDIINKRLPPNLETVIRPWPYHEWGVQPKYGAARQGRTAGPIGLIGFPCPACKHPTVNEHGRCMDPECGYTMPFETPTIVPHHQQGYQMEPAFKSPEEERPGFFQRMFSGAMDDVLGLSPQAPPQGNAFLRWTPGTKGRGVVIAGEPHTWTTIDPGQMGLTNELNPGLTHYDYVKQLGIDPSMVDFNSGVEIMPDGTVEVNAGDRDATPYIQADPRLKEGRSHSDTFFTPVNHSANSRTSNTDPYLPWTHEADAVEFEKGPLAGPQHAVMVNPGPAGIHGAHYRWLDLLDAHLDGQPARQLGIGGLMMTYADPNRKQPVEVRVHHPEHVPAIQEQLEMGQSQPVPAMQELGNRIRNGEVPPPPPREQQMVASVKEAIGIGDIAQIGIGLADPEVGAAELAGKVAPSLIGNVAGGLMKNALGISGGGGQPQQPQQEMQPNLALAAVLMADYETPASNPDVGVKTDNDPERVDTKEFNDQDKNPSNFNNPNLQDSGASGEDEVREHAGFAPDSPGLNRLEMNLPLLMHYYHSPESGESDPTIRAIHEILEGENPGYLDRVTPEEEQAAEEFVRNHGEKPHGVHAKTAIVNVDPNDINQHIQNTVAPSNPMMQPGGMMQQGHCPQCGGVLNATGQCPQCGAGAMAAGNPQTPMPTPGALPQGFASFDPLIALAAGIYHGPETAEDEMLRSDEEYWHDLQQKRGLSDEELARERAFHERADREESEYRRNAANHQGPVTPEQIAAVQELLIQEGRAEETPNVPVHPEQYVKEMAMIQQNPTVAPQVEPDEQAQPPQPQMAPPGAMPVPGMGGEPGGQPMQPMSHTGADNVAKRCPKCNSATTGILDDGGSCFCHSCGNVWTAKDLAKDEDRNSHIAADNIARRCPKCDSATTGILDEDGNMMCHSCGNVWKDKDLVEDKKGHSSRTAAPVNPVAAPAAERHRPHNPEAEEDSSLTWKDVSGQQLVPGQEYEMVNPAYELPDVIRVERVKPDGIEVSLIGTFPNEPNTLQAKTNISREDVQMQHIQFKPLAESQEDRGNEPPPGSQTPGEPPRPQTTDEADTPHAMAPLSSVKETCPRCGQKEFTSSMASETSYFNECYRCGHTWEERDEGYETDHLAHTRDWLNQSGDDDFFAGMERAQAMAEAQGGQSRNLSAIAAKDGRYQAVKQYLDSQKTAGRHFTPSEQRELIDEDGVARNADLLQLEGTHYAAREDLTGKANAANVPDAHLLMGI